MFLGETLLPLAVFPSRQGGHGVLEVWEDEFMARVGLDRCEDGPSYMSVYSVYGCRARSGDSERLS